MYWEELGSMRSKYETLSRTHQELVRLQSQWRNTMLADLASGERLLRGTAKHGDVVHVIRNLQDIISNGKMMVVGNLLQGVSLFDKPTDSDIRKKDNDLRFARRALKEAKKKGTTPIEAIATPKKRGRPRGSKNTAMVEISGGAMAIPITKKRGRPLGSKNAPKKRGRGRPRKEATSL
jgi:hypothetical protein